MKKLSSKIIICILALFSLSACQKETPVTIDNIKPTVSITINGLRTFSSDTDYTHLGLLYIQPGKQYNFTAIAADTGGVKDFTLSLDTFIRIKNVVSTPTFTSNSALVHGYRQQIYTIFGTESNPYKSFLMNGAILPNASVQQDTTITIFCTCNDYNANNTARITIPCVLTYQPPQGYGWKRY